MPSASRTRIAAMKIAPGREPPWRERLCTVSPPTSTATASTTLTPIATKSAGGRSPSPSGSSGAGAGRSRRPPSSPPPLAGAPAPLSGSGVNSFLRRPRVQCAPQLARGPLGVLGGGDRAQHAHPARPGVERLGEISRVEATDCEERHCCVRGGVADQLEAHGRPAGLGGGLVDGADPGGVAEVLFGGT